jgi:hypothetical protein
MYDLDGLFHQAEEDYHSKLLKQRSVISYMCYGYKIIKEVRSGKVTIIDMTSNGDFYKEISTHEYDTFKNLGWKTAIYVLYLSNCRTKLSRLEDRIKNAMVNNESIKVIRKLKDRRNQILNNFNKVKIKLG